MNEELIGIDGGATNVSGAVIKRIDENTFDLMGEVVTVFIKDCPSFYDDFQPQKADMLNTPISIREERQGIAYGEACEKIIAKIIAQHNLHNPTIGIGMPGIKTADQRGIKYMNNGPRIPRFLDILELRLAMANIQHRPILKLSNDSDNCGRGEFYTRQGSLRIAVNGLYIGGGTGIADALVLHGHPVPFNDVRSWMKKTWELKNEDGISYEALISQRGVMKRYATQIGTPVLDLENKGIFPEKILAENEQIKDQFITAIVSLIGIRIETLFTIKNMYFDTISLGLHLGEFLQNDQSLFKQIQLCLNKVINTSAQLTAEARTHYQQPGYLVTSELKQAPIIGAGVEAYYAAR